MSFAGHVLDMIQRARHNADLLKSKRARINKVRTAHMSSKPTSSLIDNDIKLSENEWQIYKKELHNKLKHQRKSNLYLAIILLIILTFVSGFIVWLLFYW